VSEPLPALVSTAWLGERLTRPRLRVVDASWYLPGAGRDAEAEYLAGHIPGAVFFDLDANSDPSTDLPHMLPEAGAFAERMGGLGIGDEDDVVVYDGSGSNLSAARAWWMFRAFGHDRVGVLDGGMARWRREGRPLESGRVARPAARFHARLRPGQVRTLDEVLELTRDRAEQIVDARPAGRFAGREPEPRPGLRGGHIPGSRSVPSTSLVDAEGLLLPPEELRRRFESAGVDPARPVVATCGSGTSACAVLFALHLLGQPRATLYDGSWSEWGRRTDVPIATGDGE
jgi:thiosulfate/3-mercaptopyruvate sulfurtransferase